MSALIAAMEGRITAADGLAEDFNPITSGRIRLISFT